MVITVLLVVIVAFFYFSNPALPSNSDLIRKVEAHMTTWQSKYCDEKFNIELPAIRIGEYSKTFGGWSIFASGEMACGKKTRKYDINSKAAMLMIRKNGFGYEVFTPDIINQVEEDFNQAFKELENSF